MKKFVKSGDYWAGSQAALDVVLHMQETMSAEDFKAFFGSFGDSNSGPRYSVDDNGTAILALKGSFIAADLPEWLEDMAGVRGYAGMQRDFLALAEDERVKRVVLDVDSGGGHVSGIYDATQKLNHLRSKKPVATYTSDSMYSAAYWLGSNAERVGLSPMAGVGSIGVMMVHQEFTKALDADGVTITVLRSRDNKALGGPYEALGDNARAHLERDMEFYHQAFVKQVAENRNTNATLLDQGIADGSTFLGQESVDVGLADFVGTFEDFVSEFAASTAISDVSTGGSPTLSHGVNRMTLEELQAKVGELQASVDLKEAAIVEAQTKATDLEAKVVQLEASNAALAKEAVELKADREAYSAYLEGHIQQLSVALKAEAVVPEDLEGKKQLHAKLQEKFDAKFPGGQISANSAKDPEAQATDVPAWRVNLLKRKGVQ